MEQIAPIITEEPSAAPAAAPLDQVGRRAVRTTVITGVLAVLVTVASILALGIIANGNTEKGLITLMLALVLVTPLWVFAIIATVTSVITLVKGCIRKHGNWKKTGIVCLILSNAVPVIALLVWSVPYFTLYFQNLRHFML